MQTRLVLRGLLLALAGLGLHGCGGNENTSSSCTNGFGSVCDPTKPTGGLSAIPNPATEGNNVKFLVDVADPNQNEAVTCKLDPEGDGTFQLNVSCRGTFNFVYQKVGVFQAKVQATDSQEQVITTQSFPVTVNQAAGGIPIKQIVLQRLDRQPLTGTTVCVVQPGEFECDKDITVTPGFSGTYSISPGLPQDSPTAKEFRILLTQGDNRIILRTRVDNDNLASTATFLVPIDCSGPDGCVDVLGLENPGTIATISGIVTSTDGRRIPGAQVSITGGVETGGPYSTVFTDANGQFDLPINVGNSLTSIIAKSDLLIFAAGYVDVVSEIEVSSNYFYGLNFQMEPKTVADNPLFRETFESDSTSLAQWQVAGAASDTHPDADPAVKWQLISATDQIINNALSLCVTLAPDDKTAGRLPPPVQGVQAFWYGKKPDGNFIGLGSCSDLLGGTSDSANSGTLTSPIINLTGIGNTPVRLSMKTYWEIESVNPNSGGFDLMKVQLSVDGGAFQDIGRLNPLADPVFAGDRSPLPYSNTGFNTAGFWLQQESFALPNAGGKNVRLRFEFDTVDGLFNGFRGWMIDDVTVELGQGRLATGS